MSKIPERLMNECSFCHTKGLKPGILIVEYREDVRAQNYFSSIADELKLNENGMCNECAALTGCK